MPYSSVKPDYTRTSHSAISFHLFPLHHNNTSFSFSMRKPWKKIYQESAKGHRFTLSHLATSCNLVPFNLYTTKPYSDLAPHHFTDFTSLYSVPSNSITHGALSLDACASKFHAYKNLPLPSTNSRVPLLNFLPLLLCLFLLSRW